MHTSSRPYLPSVILIALISIAFEVYLSRKRGLQNYNIRDSATSFGIFFGGIFANGAARVLTAAIYWFAYQHRFFTFTAHPLCSF